MSDIATGKPAMLDFDAMVAIDQRVVEADITGVAYYRIPPELRDFITRCAEEHMVIGFSYTQGELNFGVVLAAPASVKREERSDG